MRAIEITDEGGTPMPKVNATRPVSTDLYIHSPLDSACAHKEYSNNAKGKEPQLQHSAQEQGHPDGFVFLRF